MPSPPLKLIEWEDAFNGNHDWIAVASVPDVRPILVGTVGFEIRRDEHRVTLAMSYGDTRRSPVCCDLFTIPVGMIRSERVLA